MKNNEGLISVVLPVYNGERFLREAIESVTAQSYKNWELIIVNDCSTDSSPEIAREYALSDERIRLIDNSVNSKLPKSLNNGFREASGEYFTWISDDNRYKPEAFNTFLRYFRETDADMIYGEYDIIDEAGDFIRKSELEPLDNILLHNVIGASFMYRSSLAKKIGEYAEDRFLVEDYEYWLRCYLSGKVLHIDDNLYVYRNHGRSLTGSRMKEIIAAAEALFKDYYPCISKIKPGSEAGYRVYVKGKNMGIDKRNKLLTAVTHPSYIYFKLCDKLTGKN